ncbi:hypothetical protein NADFUDRAFT_52209 [Nadsonia fulvescens var. elongata DSM 6958]|uniref:Uncharacterized protein n=1 Tax=Nadsonia fulvescens var. elongata DSM 6958 TaxID=857566 RepID=A0A1E3PH85_9ASCO|nr:hypothetical protein NADFUDRAFT_52209 [Nadsonia fulvescens var. elongata DSM 6958]
MLTKLLLRRNLLNATKAKPTRFNSTFSTPPKYTLNNWSNNTPKGSDWYFYGLGATVVAATIVIGSKAKSMNRRNMSMHANQIETSALDNNELRYHGVPDTSLRPPPEYTEMDSFE